MTAGKSPVLVVDDDPAIQALISALLLRIPIEVEFAKDGDEAIAKLFDHGGFSVIILDLMMPRVNGFEVLHFLRAAHPELMSHVIVLTAASDKTLQYFDPREIFRLLRKPFDIQDLVDAVRECDALPPPVRVHDHPPAVA